MLLRSNLYTGSGSDQQVTMDRLRIRNTDTNINESIKEIKAASIPDYPRQPLQTQHKPKHYMRGVYFTYIMQ